jgi:hypothetical protein
MKDAETRDIGEVGYGDVVGEMLFDVCENTPQSSVIQPVWRLYRRVARVVRELRDRHWCSLV